jgi:hypothetical protein
VSDSLQPLAPLADLDREALIAGLRTAVGDDLLTLEDFADRAGTVYAATTRSEGAQAYQGLGVPLPDSWLPATVGSRAGPTVGARSVPGRWVVSVLGSAARKGRWRAAPEIVCVSLLGSTVLDFRHATYDVQVESIDIRVLMLFGSVEVILPEGVDGSLSGLVVFGSKEMQLAPAPVIPDTPFISVRGVGLFGSIELKTKGASMRERVRRALGGLPPPPPPPLPNVPTL